MFSSSWQTHTLSSRSELHLSSVEEQEITYPNQTPSRKGMNLPSMMYDVKKERKACNAAKGIG
jgi:hypothetical protein